LRPHWMHRGYLGRRFGCWSRGQAPTN